MYLSTCAVAMSILCKPVNHSGKEPTPAPEKSLLVVPTWGGALTEWGDPHARASACAIDPLKCNRQGGRQPRSVQARYS
ncbi:hypothetical protein LZ30DRAFT_736060 [Colletotrichum cereale]|nr:hypothetical protein LZ30DRAFT_736060 [Colletotrichum cereale]